MDRMGELMVFGKKAAGRWIRPLAVLGALLIPAGLAPGAASATEASGGTAATTDTSPVNLATPVNFSDGVAHQQATVTAGDARIEVLTPGLLRLEYSPSGRFENDPTVNVLNRRFPVPRYSATVKSGWLTIRTSQLTFRYKEGSGPFTPENTTLSYPVDGHTASVRPTWGWECPFGQVCQAGAAALAGGAAIATNHTGYASTAGFIASLGQSSGASATWTVLGAPVGTATLTLRYSNYVGALGGPAPRTIDLVVNGTDVKTLTLPPTASWNDWSTVAAQADLRAGTNTVALVCGTDASCNVNLDTLAVGPAGAPAPARPQTGPLGGWIRSFDYYTYASGPYSTGYTCPATAATAADCQANLEPLHGDGLLDMAGWRLLDDTRSAVWTRQGWVQPRPAGGDVEDGYLFGYGHDYATALRELSQLTGPSPLLPEYLFGVWFSRYYPYTTADYENTLIPAFRAHHVPLDTLSVDTDWKSPNSWDGWEWNPALFPEPQAFLDWAKQQGIHVTLNIHSSISDSDPRLPAAESVAGGTLGPANCFSGPCKVWDWSQIPQAESNFSLQQQFEQQGAAFWWLDWCCDNSSVSMPGLTPDSWIDHLYAQELVNKGKRGFVLARIGSSYQSPGQVYAAGPWSNHTSAVDFTGDTWGTWNTLARQAELSPAEASIGQPYVSDDIGSFLGPPPGGDTNHADYYDTPDLYDRWVQLGAFQPILRLHSSHGYRLPWNYPQPVRSITEQFLRLREALVPYTYTLAAQSHATGMPITRPLYLDYPDSSAAYDHPGEYLYGPDVLVAPVTTPGQVATSTVWFPPGRWTDYFTGATFTGPATASLTVPLDRMPVFVKAGGIVPEQPPMSHVGAKPASPLTLDVYAGGTGQFTLYSDAGAGLGYTRGQYATTPICYLPGAVAPGAHGGSCAAAAVPGQAGAAGTTTVVVGAARGHYPGELTSRAYQVNLVDISMPKRVLVNHRPLPMTASGGSAAGWHYDAATATLTVRTPSLPTGRAASITQIGGHPVTRPEPAAVSLSLNPPTPVTLAAGTSATVTATVRDDGPGSVTHAAVRLTAPQGWTVSPSTPAALAALTPGGSATASWKVTAPAGTAGQQSTAALQATVTYASAVTGTPGSVTAVQQPAPPPPPPPVPAITSVTPPSGQAGTVVTITGTGFGSAQGSGYLTLADQGTSWGAPYDSAKLQIASWSDTKIVFTLPSPSGPGGVWHLVPGTTATVTVTTSGGTSGDGQIAITGSLARSYCNALQRRR